MNEGFPVKNIQRQRPREEAPMPSQFTAEDFARAIDTAEREFPIAHILPERLSTMVESTRKNLADEGADKKIDKKAFEKAITAALKSHRGVIMLNRRKLYRRAVEILLEAESNQSADQEVQKISPRVRLDMLNTEHQRGGDPTD